MCKSITMTVEQQRKLAYLDAEIIRAELFARNWIVMAESGVAKLRDIKRGRKVTQEKHEKGEVIGWTPLTDEEKTKDAIETAFSHINRMGELTDSRNAVYNEIMRTNN